MSKYKPREVRAEQAKAHIAEMAQHWSRRNKEVFDDLDKQSSKVFWWRCRRGHHWEDKMAAVRSRPLPLCPQCRAERNKRKKQLKE